MSGIGKIFVVLNLAFSLVIVGAAAAYLAKADDWKSQFDELNGKYIEEKGKWAEEQVQLQEQLRIRDEENTNKQNKIEDLELEVSNAKASLKSEEVSSQQLRDDVTKINSVLENFQTNMNELNTRNAELADQNAELRNQALDAQNKQREAEDNLRRVETELEQANQQIQELEKTLTAANKHADDLQNIMSVAQQQGFDTSSIVAAPEIPAVVKEVNNELGFVILSAGARNNVKKGYAFQIYRGSDYLGEVVVDDVYPDYCAARIKFIIEGAQFKVNDKANTLL